MQCRGDVRQGNAKGLRKNRGKLKGKKTVEAQNMGKGEERGQGRAKNEGKKRNTVNRRWLKQTKQVRAKHSCVLGGVAS